MTEKGEEMREERKGRVKRQTDRQTDRAKLWNTDWGGGGGGEARYKMLSIFGVDPALEKKNGISLKICIVLSVS